MLICKGVNVFPTAVRDLVSTFAAIYPDSSIPI
jgi:hypothetical protein